MSVRRNPAITPPTEVDLDIECEVARLLDLELANQPASSQQTRPSLLLLPSPDAEFSVAPPHTPLPPTLESCDGAASTKETKLTVQPTISPVVKKRHVSNQLTPTSFATSPQSNLLSPDSHVKLPAHQGGRSVSRPPSSTSRFSSFTLRPTSGLSFRPPSSLSIQSSMLAIPDNVRNFMIKAIDKARGIKRHGTPDPLDSPCSSVSDFKVSVVSQGALMRRLDSFCVVQDEDILDDGRVKRRPLWRRVPLPKSLGICKKRLTCSYYIDPHGEVYFVWMVFIAIAFLYNAIFVPLRAAFQEEVQPNYLLPMWFFLDYVFDIIFLLDIFLFQSHLSYRDQGVLVSDPTLITVRYCCSWAFLIDALAILPTDFLYAVPRLMFNAVFRINRILKFRGFQIFLDRFESRTRFPHGFRLAKISTIFLYTIHVNTCLYYGFSKSQGLGSTEWVYSGNGTSYIRCFYWSLLSLATINDNLPNPTNTPEFTFTMFNYLLGVFVMALFISQMSSLWESYDYPRLSFRRKWDRIKEFMIRNKIPKDIQKRVQAWYNYASSQQVIFDEQVALKALPKKMKADLAIHVHLDTLSKVTLFQDCEKTLLRELVLKLRPCLFVPNDYICKKGEIGKEMYIVHEGLVAVVGGAEDNEVLAELGPGSIFGEISLLAVGGGNRRSASVVSKGFSTLFVLSKKDLNETLVDYPEAEESLEKKARYLLHQDKKREVRRNRQRGLTNSAQQLRQNIRNNEVAKLAVTAMATAAKNVKGADGGQAEEDPEEEGAQRTEGRVDSQERSQRSSDGSLMGSLLSRLKRGSRVAPSPKESVCSEDAQSDHSTAIVERFRRLLELQQQPNLGGGGDLDSPDPETRTRAHSFDESIGTPSLVNTSISAADRWQFASAALSSDLERVSPSRRDRHPTVGSDISCDSTSSPSKLAQSLKWPNARDVVSMGSGLSSLYSDDNSQVSSDFEDNLLEDESLL